MDLCIADYRPQYSASALVPVAFQQQAKAFADKPCLVAEDGSFLTFAQVDAAATVLARRLAARGVGRDVAVGILLDRSPTVVVSMLAVHKVIRSKQPAQLYSSNEHLQHLHPCMLSYRIQFHEHTTTCV